MKPGGRCEVSCRGRFVWGTQLEHWFYMWDCVEVSPKNALEMMMMMKMNFKRNSIEGYFGVQKIMRQPWSQLFARGCPEHQWILSQKGAKLAFGTCIFVFQPCNYSIHTFTGHPAYKHIDMVINKYKHKV